MSNSIFYTIIIILNILLSFIRRRYTLISKEENIQIFTISALSKGSLLKLFNYQLQYLNLSNNILTLFLDILQNTILILTKKFIDLLTYKRVILEDLYKNSLLDLEKEVNIYIYQKYLLNTTILIIISRQYYRRSYKIIISL